MKQFFVPFTFLSSSMLSFQYLYVFALNPANSFMICTPDSSFNNSITFLVFSLGNGLFNFYKYLLFLHEH